MPPTTGPYSAYRDGDTLEICDDHGDVIAVMGADCILEEEQTANAMLLAASWYMLVALRKILAHECQQIPCMVCAAYAKAAIEEATTKLPQSVATE